MAAFFRGALEQARGRGGNAGALTGKTVAVEGYRVRVGAVLASGGFGFVYHVTDAVTAAPYALKHVMPGDSPEALDVVRTELQIADSLAAHPHAVRLLAATPRPPTPRSDVLLLMELCDSSLATLLQSQPAGLPEHEALLACRAVACVLAALHAAGVSHWDVKPENVLRAGGAWKLCDFGSATTRQAGPVTARERGRLEDAIQHRTTPAYRAPELWDLDAHATVGPAADVWALGCMLGASLGALPFQATDKLRVLSARFQPPARASLGTVALQQRCLAVSPEGRPSALEVVDSLDALLSTDDAPAAAPVAAPAPAANAPPPLPPRPRVSSEASAAPQQDPPPAVGPGWCAQFD